MVTKQNKKAWFSTKRHQDICLTFDGLLIYADRVMIAETLQIRVLKGFPIGQSGLSKLKALMFSYVY